MSRHGRTIVGGSTLALFTLVALALLLPGASRATGPCTITWVGDVDGNWLTNTAGNTNWNDNTLPLFDDRVCIPNAGSQPVTMGPSSATVTDYQVSAGATLVIPGGIVLKAKADSTNAGTIILTGGSSWLQTEDGNAAAVETLTNTGAISIPSNGALGDRLITGNLVNQGTITVATTGSFQRGGEGTQPKLTNTGTVTVASGGSLRLLDAALEQRTGGTINGPGTLYLLGESLNAATLRRLILAGGAIAANADVALMRGGPALQFSGGAPTGRVRVAADSGDHPLEGDIPAGVTIDVGGKSKLLAPASLTNAGTVNLLGASSRLDVAGDFVNGGAISFTVGPTSFSSMTARQAKLGGQLLVTTTGTPAKAERRIVSSVLRTGSFASASFAGAFYDVNYDAKGVTLSGPVTPVQGKTVAAGPVSGTVKVRAKGSSRFTTLTSARAIPVGSEVDTTRGTVAIASATRRGGATQTAQFSAGRFTAAQTRASPLTTASLSGPELKTCAKPSRAAGRTARKRPTRKLFGSGKGTFATKGRYGTASIRGTKWLVQDFCDRTVVKSLEGTVSVRDLVKRRTVQIKTGQSYTARRA